MSTPGEIAWPACCCYATDAPWPWSEKLMEGVAFNADRRSRRSRCQEFWLVVRRAARGPSRRTAQRPQPRLRVVRWRRFWPRAAGWDRPPPGGKASRSPLGRKRRQLLKEVGQIEWFFHQAGGIARRGVRELIGAAAHHDNGQTRQKIGQALKSVPAGFDTQIQIKQSDVDVVLGEPAHRLLRIAGRNHLIILERQRLFQSFAHRRIVFDQ